MGAEVAEVLGLAFPVLLHQFSQPFLLLCLAPVLICSHNVSSSLRRDFRLAPVGFVSTFWSTNITKDF